MAATEYAATTTAGGNPPLAYDVAVWMGMPREQIIAGLKDGTVAPPPGAPVGSLLPWAPCDGWIPPPNDERGPIIGDEGSVSTGTPTAPDSADSSAEVYAGTPPDASALKLDGDATRSLLVALDPDLTDAKLDTACEASGPDDATRERTLFDSLRRPLLHVAGCDGSRATTCVQKRR